MASLSPVHPERTQIAADYADILHFCFRLHCQPFIARHGSRRNMMTASVLDAIATAALAASSCAVSTVDEQQ